MHTDPEPQQLASVFFNLALRDKYFGFKSDHPIAWAGDLIVSAHTNTAAANKVWHWAQRADGLNGTAGVMPHGERTEQATGDAWLDAREMPSLSVGDVFLIGPLDRSTAAQWYATASIGFDHLTLAPSLVSWQADLRSEIDRVIDQATASTR